jgi:hypothetical protein
MQGAANRPAWCQGNEIRGRVPEQVRDVMGAGSGGLTGYARNVGFYSEKSFEGLEQRNGFCLRLQ